MKSPHNCPYCGSELTFNPKRKRAIWKDTETILMATNDRGYYVYEHKCQACKRSVLMLTEPPPKPTTTQTIDPESLVI